MKGACLIVYCWDCISIWESLPTPRIFIAWVILMYRYLDTCPCYGVWVLYSDSHFLWDMGTDVRWKWSFKCQTKPPILSLLPCTMIILQWYKQNHSFVVTASCCDNLAMLQTKPQILSLRPCTVIILQCHKQNDNFVIAALCNDNLAMLQTKAQFCHCGPVLW